MHLLKNSIFTITVFLSLLIPIQLIAQDSTKKQNPLIISGYAEVYYGYDFNKPANNSKPSFIYSHNRTNEVNLNLGFLKGAYSSDWVRANLSFAAGTYITANYASEPDGLKHIYEANIGIRLSNKNNFGWMPALCLHTLDGKAQ